ncbi:unnamed protein product, partial [Didymodactylos carnosus]
LKEVSQISHLELSEVLDFKEEKAFFLMLTAFNKDSVYNKQKELFQKSTTIAKFSELIQDLRVKIFDEANYLDKQFKSLSDWVKQATDIWTTIDSYNNMIMIDSIKEINEREDLGNIITEIMKDFIELKQNANETSFCSKLETMLKEQEELINTPNNIDSDIQKQFEDEERSFREKVVHRFEQEIKSKSFAEKLINEYRDRLCYTIMASKTQA